MNLRRRFSSYLALNLMKLPNLSRLSGGGATFDKNITRENQEAIPLQGEELLVQRITTPSILQLFLFFFLVHAVGSDGGEKFIQQCRDFGPNAWNTCLEAFVEEFRMRVSHASSSIRGCGGPRTDQWLLLASPLEPPVGTLKTPPLQDTVMAPGRFSKAQPRADMPGGLHTVMSVVPSAS